jgi:NAD(P)-dependent dehydrogenase (short-subunit alcohol dehydrogenase family)
MPDVKGKLAIVTGASSGLGQATALRLAGLGARVALLARSGADLDRVAARINDAGAAAWPLPTDLADPACVAATLERIAADADPPRVLINAAGTDAPGPAAEIAQADWERVVRVNLTAPFLLSRAVFPRMRVAGGGTIVNTRRSRSRWPGSST